MRRTLGLWDVLYDREIIPVVKAVRKWEADHEDKEKELRKLNVDLATIEADLVASGDEEDPIYQFRKHFSKTGSYLRPDDIKFCLTKTSFTEEQTIDWFQRFRTDCPDGKLTVDHLRGLFKQAFPDGDGVEFSSHIMRLFDCDGNGYLDFKEFLMAIDIATCRTEESRLAWVFKLYDVDNDGVIDVDEMARVMETFENLETSGKAKTNNKVGRRGPTEANASLPSAPTDLRSEADRCGHYFTIFYIFLHLAETLGRNNFVWMDLSAPHTARQCGSIEQI